MGIKYLLQKIFRKDHISDPDIWNFNDYFIMKMYKPFKKFVEMEKHGYPTVFSEYDPSWCTSEEDYIEAKKNGEIIGGEEKKWDEVLNKILFAFEFYLADDYDKYYKKFIKKYGEKYDWLKETESNKSKLKLGEKIRDVYVNVSLYHELNKKAQEGMNLFGKYVMNMWD